MNLDDKRFEENIEPLFYNNKFDEAAFEAFFKKYFVPLCAYCQFKFGFDLNLSKDAVHSGFLKLWEARESVSPNLSLKSYLYKVVTNICIDILKHQKVKSKKEKYIQENNLHSNVNDGFVQADIKELSNEINIAIGELPEQMRKVFELCRFEGLKYAEVASQLSISVKTVETQMSRALAKLRQRLANYLPFIIVLMYFNSKL